MYNNKSNKQAKILIIMLFLLFYFLGATYLFYDGYIESKKYIYYSNE